jgi:hypothetical protein
MSERTPSVKCGTPNVARVQITGGGICGFTPSWRQQDSVFCSAPPAYVVRDVKNDLFEVCVEHAIFVRTHERFGERVALIATAEAPSGGTR